jgi:ribosome biogenesis protein Nip4
MEWNENSHLQTESTTSPSQCFTSVARSNLISLGTCFGKFSKTGKFKLGITSLDWLAKYAKYKVRLGRAWARLDESDLDSC